MYYWLIILPNFVEMRGNFRVMQIVEFLFLNEKLFILLVPVLKWY